MIKTYLQKIVFILSACSQIDNLLQALKEYGICYDIVSQSECTEVLNEENYTYLEESIITNLGCTSEGTLILTDLNQLASKLASEKIAVLGCLTGDNQSSFFGGVRFLASEVSELTVDYLERVYRRYYHIPWDILTTEHLLLRETSEQDLDDFYQIYAHPDITKYMENLYDDREQEKQYIINYQKNIYEFYEFGIWTVILKETGEVIGRAGISMREGYEEPELGFMIGKPWQRKGYAYEACRAILRYTRELGFQDMIAFTRPENTSSISLLRKLGMRQEKEVMIDEMNYMEYHIKF